MGEYTIPYLTEWRLDELNTLNTVQEIRFTLLLKG